MNMSMLFWMTLYYSSTPNSHYVEQKAGICILSLHQNCTFNQIESMIMANLYRRILQFNKRLSPRYQISPILDSQLRFYDPNYTLTSQGKYTQKANCCLYKLSINIKTGEIDQCYKCLIILRGIQMMQKYQKCYQKIKQMLLFRSMF